MYTPMYDIRREHVVLNIGYIIGKRRPFVAGEINGSPLRRIFEMLELERCWCDVLRVAFAGARDSDRRVRVGAAVQSVTGHEHERTVCSVYNFGDRRLLRNFHAE